MTRNRTVQRLLTCALATLLYSATANAQLPPPPTASSAPPPASAPLSLTACMQTYCSADECMRTLCASTAPGCGAVCQDLYRSPTMGCARMCNQFGTQTTRCAVSAAQSAQACYRTCWGSRDPEACADDCFFKNRSSYEQCQAASIGASSPSSSPTSPSNTATSGDSERMPSLLHRSSPPPAPPEPPRMETRYPPAPRPVPAILAGTRIGVRVLDAIDSDGTSPDLEFKASLDETLVIGDIAVAPVGSPAVLRVVQVREAKAVSGRASLTLRLGAIQIDGQWVPVESGDAEITSGSQTANVAKKGVVGALVGAAIGGLFGGGKGAAKGAAIGGASGVAAAVLQGEKVHVPAEQRLSFKLTKDVPLPLRVP